jgi:predicted nucleic-acid-binding Zn-ribbon protein
MRIQVRLPQIEPDVYDEPQKCPKCDGQHFKPHGVKGEAKTIRDLAHKEVKSFRQKCVRCGYRMRVYPRG